MASIACCPVSRWPLRPTRSPNPSISFFPDRLSTVMVDCGLMCIFFVRQALSASSQRTGPSGGCTALSASTNGGRGYHRDVSGESAFHLLCCYLLSTSPVAGGWCRCWAVFVSSGASWCAPTFAQRWKGTAVWTTAGQWLVPRPAVPIIGNSLRRHVDRNGRLNTLSAGILNVTLAQSK